MSGHHRHIPPAVSLTPAPMAAAPSMASPRPFGPIAPAATTQPKAAPAVNPPARHATNIKVGGIQAEGARVADKLAARDAAIGSAIQSSLPPLILRFSPPHGFAWDDANTGAGAKSAGILILAGSAISLTHRLGRRCSYAAYDHSERTRSTTYAPGGSTSYLSVNPSFQRLRGTGRSLGPASNPNTTGNRSYTRARTCSTTQA
jgi:hypothetical protein